MPQRKKNIMIITENELARLIEIERILSDDLKRTMVRYGPAIK